MLLSILFSASLILTATMFITKNSLLGFPSAIFWAITGGECYVLSAATWDIYYIMFFACVLGMTIFTMLSAYALRKRDLTGPDADQGAFFDEGKSSNEIQEPSDNAPGTFSDETTVAPSKRVQALHKRAEERRSGEVRMRKQRL